MTPPTSRAELLPELSEFDTATPINKYLERLLVLATKERVTPRRAAVLAYLTNQLLHSVHAMGREDASESETIIFDLPAPNAIKSLSLRLCCIASRNALGWRA